MRPGSYPRALRRRCLFLHIDYPTPELEQQIVQNAVPGLPDALAESVVRLVARLGVVAAQAAEHLGDDHRPHPPRPGAADLSPQIVTDNLGVLLKHRDDIERATAALAVH